MKQTTGPKKHPSTAAISTLRQMQKTLSVANLVKPSIQKLDNLPSPDKPSQNETIQEQRKMMGNKALSTNELRKLTQSTRQTHDRSSKQSQDANELLAHFLKQTNHEQTEHIKRKNQPYTDGQLV